MPDQRVDPAVSVATVAPGQVDADVVAIPIFDDDELPDVVGLDAAIGGEVARVTGKSGRSGGAANNAATACESQVLESLSKEVRIVLTGSAD